jgi:hypothetical protein
LTLPTVNCSAFGARFSHHPLPMWVCDLDTLAILLDAGARAYLTTPLDIRRFLAVVDRIGAGQGGGRST